MSSRDAATAMLLAALVAATACERYGRDSLPTDPGTVVVSVVDESGAPMSGVWVYVHDIPNDVGSTFSEGIPTDATGSARFRDIPAGPRRAEVKPPAGYASATPVIPVDVVKGGTVVVTFTLNRI